MKEYVIKKISKKEEVKDLEKLEVDNVLWLEDVGIRMSAQIGYDDEKLYLHMMAKEKDIRAVANDQFSRVCEDSCMEFFFSPKDERYYNFEVNLNGAYHIGFGYNRHQKIRIIQKEMEIFEFTSAKTEDGWWIDYVIPFSFINVIYPDFKPQAGDTMRANLYKCGDKCVHEHYLSWNKVECEKPDFHRPEYFGLLKFE